MTWVAGTALPSFTRVMRAPEGNIWCTIIERDGEPIRISLGVGKGSAGEQAAAWALSSLAGACLRRGMTISDLRRYLKGVSIVSDEAIKSGEFEAQSMADALARTLEEAYL